LGTPCPPGTVAGGDVPVGDGCVGYEGSAPDFHPRRISPGEVYWYRAVMGVSRNYLPRGTCDQVLKTWVTNVASAMYPQYSTSNLKQEYGEIRDWLESYFTTVSVK
jgi:hypothetical protein